MINRKERIYNELKRSTEDILNSKKDIWGISTLVIADSINIDRSNVSRELNLLIKENKAIKIKGKPTLYLEKASLCSRYDTPLTENTFESIQALKEYLANASIKNFNESFNEKSNKMPNQFSSDSFKNLIGYGGSLKQQIEQAKSGVLYPPNGLHMLILGETGVGKSTFVDAIHSFLMSAKNNKTAAPLVTLNCADYSYNFQLIYAQLFGYVKGAFTGADKDKEGLIEEAKGGILFLDEVHRLPPEAQEMLFQVMDKGQYRKLSDTKITYNNSVLIICATTEDPSCSMLKSFIRRIPIIINIPNLASRPDHEKLEAMNYFFNKECIRLNEPMCVTRHVFLCLLSHEFKANIGELYSTIQIMCAKAYLDKIMHDKASIEVEISHIPKPLLEGYAKNRFTVEEKENFYPFLIKELVSYNPEQINTESITYNFQDKYNYDYYSLIQKEYDKLTSKDHSKTDVWNQLEIHIEDYFQHFFYKLQGNVELDEQSILKFIDSFVYFKVLDIIDKIPEIGYIRSNFNILYGFMLHIDNLVNRIRQNRYIKKINIEKIKGQYRQEYLLADKIKSCIEKSFYILIPEDETAVLTLFIHSTKYIGNKDISNVMIICHGNSVASGIADVANRLLGVNHAIGLDMPLDMNINDMESEAINIVLKNKNSKGVLLLVDMGSLTYLDKIITEQAKIPAKVIDMISTPIAIEATRKSMLPNMTLDILEADLKSFVLTKKSLNNGFLNENNDFLKKVYTEILYDTFIFLDPAKAIDLLLHSFNFIVNHFKLHSTEGLIIKYLFHTSAMLERVIKKETLNFYKDENETLNNSELLNVIKEAHKLVEQNFGIEIPLSDL